MQIKHYFFIVVPLALSGGCRTSEVTPQRQELAEEIEHSIQTELLNKWYPQAMDTVFGGYLSSFTFDFKPTGDQDKMIVSQARHVWTSAKASVSYPEVDYYKDVSAHGA